MADTVPGGLGGGPLDFIPGILNAGVEGAKAAPSIMAAFGNKKAARFLSQQASIDCAKTGGDWNEETATCDMGPVIARQIAEARSNQLVAEGRTAVDKIKAWAMPLTLGVGACALAFAASRAFQRRG